MTKSTTTRADVYSRVTAAKFSTWLLVRCQGPAQASRQDLAMRCLDIQW